MITTSYSQHPSILPGGCYRPDKADQAEAVERAREVKSLYKEAITSLPGVTGIGIGGGLRIYTQNAQDRDFLKGMLRDKVDGVKLNYVVTGPITASAAKTESKDATDAQGIALKYGPALSRLPGVSGVEVKQRKMGPMLPAFEDVLVVSVSSTASLKYASLVRDRIDTTPVKFEPRTCFGSR